MDSITEWDVLRYIWGGLLSVLGWLGLKQMARIERLENSRVEKVQHERELEHIQNETQKAIARVEVSLSEHRSETSAAINRILQRLDQVADRIGNFKQ